MSEQRNYDEFIKAQNALRDIHYLFKVFADYQCLDDDLCIWQTGSFDPLYFIDWNDATCDLSDDEIDLLHHGSAILVFCEILRAWSQGNYPNKENAFINEVKRLLDNNRMNHIPDLKTAIEKALISENEGNAVAGTLYDRYVSKYFQKLAANARPLTN